MQRCDYLPREEVNPDNVGHWLGQHVFVEVDDGGYEGILMFVGKSRLILRDLEPDTPTTPIDYTVIEHMELV